MVENLLEYMSQYLLSQFIQICNLSQASNQGGNRAIDPPKFSKSMFSRWVQQQVAIILPPLQKG